MFLYVFLFSFLFFFWGLRSLKDCRGPCVVLELMRSTYHHKNHVKSHFFYLFFFIFINMCSILIICWLWGQAGWLHTWGGGHEAPWDHWAIQPWRGWNLQCCGESDQQQHLGWEHWATRKLLVEKNKKQKKTKIKKRSLPMDAPEWKHWRESTFDTDLNQNPNMFFSTPSLPPLPPSVLILPPCASPGPI